MYVYVILSVDACEHAYMCIHVYVHVKHVQQIKELTVILQNEEQQSAWINKQSRRLNDIQESSLS